MACSSSEVLRTQQDRQTTAPATPVRTGTDSGVIPAGSEFAVRTNERIEATAPGQRYSAQLAQDIEDNNGRLLAPKGASAVLTVVELDSGGTVGTRKVALAIDSVTVNGRTHRINTMTTEEGGPSGLGKNRRTAEMVGGGAAIGALIGAIAGGGDGAAIGAAIGGGAGAATQVLTRGDKVQIPAETVLTFRLGEPWRLS